MSSENKKFDPAKLIAFSAKALQRVGVPEEDALVTGRILVATDLMGIDSHGVAHLANFYITRINNDEINAKPNMKMTSNSSTTAILDLIQV